jgi:hypothetical protein
MKTTVQELKARVDYNSNTGQLTWKYRDDMPARFNNRWTGKPAFNNPDANGYLRGSINNETLYAHRVAFAILYGEYRNDIYFFNGNKRDLTFRNLRAHGLRPYGVPLSALEHLP